MKKLCIFLSLVVILFSIKDLNELRKQMQQEGYNVHTPDNDPITTPIQDTPLKDWSESYPDHSGDMDTSIPGYTPSEETGGTTVTTPVHEQDNDDNTVFNDNGDRVVNPPKQESPIWNDLDSYREKTRTNGLSGSKKQYYEWDYTHNDIEVYDHNGKHLGSMNPTTGEMYKPAKPGRTIPIK